MSGERTRVAVYGTLRSVFIGHSIIRNARPVWRGYVYLPYKMVVSNCIPYLVPSEKLHKIFIEVYEVPSDVLRELDEYEDVPHDYVRINLYVHPVEFVNLYIASKQVEGEEVSSGDFLEYACRRCRETIRLLDACRDVSG